MHLEYYDFQRCEEMASGFKGVGMKNFIERYVVENDGRTRAYNLYRYICYPGSHNLERAAPIDLQIALYIQGIKYFNSQTRRLV